MASGAPPTAGAPVADGRRARRERGRLAVIDAMVDLVQEGQLPPSPDLVAERAGVSVASLFRYFDDLDELQLHVVARFQERFAPAFEVPAIGDGPMDARVDRYVRARVALYEQIAPMARLARARALERPNLARSLHETRARQALQVREHFAPELASRTPAVRDDLVGCICALTSFESWDLHHGDLERGRTQIVRAWTTALRGLLAPAAPPRP